MNKIDYIDEVLDVYGEIGPEFIWELYLQVNLEKYCNYDKEGFYDIYYSLFLDDIEKFKTIELNQENEECCEIIYSELLGQAKYCYPIADFISEVDKSKWVDIIEKSQIINDQDINITIYNFFKNKYGTSN